MEIKESRNTEVFYPTKCNHENLKELHGAGWKGCVNVRSQGWAGKSPGRREEKEGELTVLW